MIPATADPLPSEALAIDLRQVSKTYGRKVRALVDVALQVRRGEVFGLLGPNGAGKSTLVKILMSVISPSRCTGTMLGRHVGDKSALARVGYLPEHHRFPEYLTGAQVVDLFGAMAGAPRKQRRKRIPELLELVGMSTWGDRRLKQYSKGMRQRIGLAQALANDPDLLLLDEPTDGVDPVGRRDIRNLLLQLRDRGKTVFVNSHLLSELEMVCNRVAILVQGKVWAQGTLDELTRPQRRYEIEFEPPGSGEDPSHLAVAVPMVLERVAPEISRSMEGGILTLQTADAAAIQPVIDAARAARLTIRAVRPWKPSLEDLFMQAVSAPGSGGVGAKEERR